MTDLPRDPTTSTTYADAALPPADDSDAELLHDADALEQLWNEFHTAVTMTSPELRDWLGSSAEVEGAGGARPVPPSAGTEGMPLPGIPPATDPTPEQVAQARVQVLLQSPTVRRSVGERVAEVLGKRRGDLTVDDVGAMRAVVSFVEREHPDPDAGDLSDDAWRRRLMDVGHDPLAAPRR